MKRMALLILTNLAVLLVVALLAELTGLDAWLARQGSVIIIGAADLVRGCRRLYATLARDPAVSAAAVQAVGSAGRHGFVIAVVSDPR